MACSGLILNFLPPMVAVLVGGEILGIIIEKFIQIGFGTSLGVVLNFLVYSARIGGYVAIAALIHFVLKVPAMWPGADDALSTPSSGPAKNVVF